MLISTGIFSSTEWRQATTSQWRGSISRPAKSTTPTIWPLVRAKALSWECRMTRWRAFKWLRGKRRFSFLVRHYRAHPTRNEKRETMLSRSCRFSQLLRKETANSSFSRHLPIDREVSSKNQQLGEVADLAIQRDANIARRTVPGIWASLGTVQFVLLAGTYFTVPKLAQMPGTVRRAM